jgi:hypothetical protein
LFGIGIGATPPGDYRGWFATDRERAWRAQTYEILLARGVVLAPHLVGCLSTPMTHTEIDRLVDDVRNALLHVNNQPRAGSVAS